MKLNDEENKALEFFGLSEDFDRHKLLEYCERKKSNKYLDAMYSDDSIVDIENDIKKYYRTLEFYLLKKSYYDKLKETYLNGIVKEDDSMFSIEINNSNSDYLNDLEVLSDLNLLLITLYKRLDYFESLLERANDEGQVVKIFNDFSQIMEKEINSYKEGKLSFKGKIIDDLKGKINDNFERGSKEYQHMVSRYFTALLGAKDDDDCMLIYNAAINEIDSLLSTKKVK